MTPPVATVLVVFGRGLMFHEGSYTLPPAGVARVQAAADYVVAHADAFSRAAGDGRPPRIVFSGGWPEAAEGADPPPAGCREGELMRYQACQLGLAGHAELHAETESRSTLENVLLTAGAGLLDGYEFSQRQPLGIVAHPGHLPRIRFLLRKAIGLSGEGILDIPAHGPDAPTGPLPERVMNLVAHLSFLGVRDSASLLRRERRIVRSVRRMQRIKAGGARRGGRGAE